MVIVFYFIFLSLKPHFSSNFTYLIFFYGDYFF